MSLIVLWINSEFQYEKSTNLGSIPGEELQGDKLHLEPLTNFVRDSHYSDSNSVEISIILCQHTILLIL